MDKFMDGFTLRLNRLLFNIIITNITLKLCDSFVTIHLVAQSATVTGALPCLQMG